MSGPNLGWDITYTDCGFLWIGAVLRANDAVVGLLRLNHGYLVLLSISWESKDRPTCSMLGGTRYWPAYRSFWTPYRKRPRGDVGVNVMNITVRKSVFVSWEYLTSLMSVLMINVRVELKFMSPGGLSACRSKASFSMQFVGERVWT